MLHCGTFLHWSYREKTHSVLLALETTVLCIPSLLKGISVDFSEGGTCGVATLSDLEIAIELGTVVCVE